MAFQISDEIINQTTRCLYDFECLTNDNWETSFIDRYDPKNGPRVADKCHKKSDCCCYSMPFGLKYKAGVEQGMGLVDATLEGASLRFRPIIMTSLAFGFGVLPLAVATGAGAGAQNAIGTGVLGGIVTATVLVIIFAPLFFVLIETILGKGRKGETAATGGANPFFTVLKEKLFKRKNRQATVTEDVKPSED